MGLTELRSTTVKSAKISMIQASKSEFALVRVRLNVEAIAT
jgi:hypothetical protein